MAGYLLGDEPEALLRAHKFISLAQQGVEGLAGALRRRSVATDSKACHVDEPFIAAWRVVGSLQDVMLNWSRGGYERHHLRGL